jgi:hypothetical protein
MNEEFEAEFIEKFAKKIYELCPYSEEEHPSYETKIIPWQEVYTSKDKYRNVVKEMINELSLELYKNLPEAEQEIYNANLNKW